MTWDLHETWVRSATTNIWLRPQRTNRDSSPPPVTILDTDWDAYTTGAPILNADMWDAMGSVIGNNTTNFDEASIVAVAGRGKVYQQHFTSGLFFNNGDGVAMNVPLAQTVDEATISYDMRWLSGSDYGGGGKLPGLAGVAPGQGSPPSGGTPNAYGWASRGMWIVPGFGTSYSPCEWIGYWYHPQMTPGSFGINLHTGVGFGGVGDPALGTWANYRQYHKLNTVITDGTAWSSNGIHRMWRDDVLVYEATNVVYRKYTAARITHMQWSLFYGGGDSSWAPASDSDIQIDNLLVTSP